MEVAVQMAQPITSPLGYVLWAAVIALVFLSPKKLQTLARMAIAFAVTALLLIIPPAILRIGDPFSWGRISGLVALFSAVAVGWVNVRRMRRCRAGQ